MEFWNATEDPHNSHATIEDAGYSTHHTRVYKLGGCDRGRDQNMRDDRALVHAACVMCTWHTRGFTITTLLPNSI
jgi:hypothetical protein